MDILKLYAYAVTVVLMFCCGLWSEKASAQEDTLLGPGLNICVKKRAISRHIISTKSFMEPVYKPYLRACYSWTSRMCSFYRTVYKRTYRNVTLTKLDVVKYYTCCPGWRRNKGSNECNIAICIKPCKNGGVCTKPNSCTCTRGWTGADCGEDVNECANKNGGCSQTCINTYGSYNCTCKDGYIAQGKRCEVCLECSKEWKRMEERMVGLEKELSTLRSRMMSYSSGIQMLSHSTEETEKPRGLPGPKGEKGDTGPQGPPGPPAEVLGSLLGRLAHFEEFIDKCECVKKPGENEQERTDTDHAIATNPS